MNTACLKLQTGEEYVFDPHTHPLARWITAVRTDIVDKYGRHLTRLGLFNMIKPAPTSTVTSQCIASTTPNHQQHTIMRIAAHLITTKTASHGSIPQLIVSSFPINFTHHNFTKAKTCKDICKKHPKQCICLKHFETKPTNRVIYLIRNKQWHRLTGNIKYFNTIGSVLVFDRFNMFNRKLLVKAGNKTKYKVSLTPAETHSSTALVLNGNGSEHILLRAVVSHMLRTHPITHIQLSSTGNDSNVNMTVISLRPRGKVHLFDVPLIHSKFCIMNQENHNCEFTVFSGYDHHISIESTGNWTHNLTLKLHTSHTNVHPEPVMIYGRHHLHHGHSKHYGHHSHGARFVAWPLLCGVSIVFALTALVICAVFYCLTKRKRRNRQTMLSRGLTLDMIAVAEDSD